MELDIVVNGRYRVHAMTGIQRYAHEVVQRLVGGVQVRTPSLPLKGIAGHAWEQFVLPGRLGNRLLWSPSSSGPIRLHNQVVTIHDIAPIDHPEWFSRSFRNWYKIMLPRLANRVRMIVVDSHFTRDRVIERFKIPEEKIHVVPCGVDARFQPLAAERVASVGARLNLGHDRYVLCLGSLEPRKNFARVLEAWAKVPQYLRKGTTLVVAGGAGSARVFSDAGLSSIPPGVKMIGYVPDDLLPALYSGAEAFVYPSLYEGFGLPVLEAMACGTPVITSRGGAISELTDGTAISVDPLSSAAIASGLATVLGDDRARRRMSKEARDRSLDFDWGKTASTIQGLLSRAASEI